jgi:hypothetical protein
LSGLKGTRRWNLQFAHIAARVFGLAAATAVGLSTPSKAFLSNDDALLKALLSGSYSGVAETSIGPLFVGLSWPIAKMSGFFAELGFSIYELFLASCLLASLLVLGLLLKKDLSDTLVFLVLTFGFVPWALSNLGYTFIAVLLTGTGILGLWVMFFRGLRLSSFLSIFLMLITLGGALIRSNAVLPSFLIGLFFVGSLVGAGLLRRIAIEPVRFALVLLFPILVFLVSRVLSRGAIIEGITAGNWNEFLVIRSLHATIQGGTPRGEWLRSNTQDQYSEVNLEFLFRHAPLAPSSWDLSLVQALDKTIPSNFELIQGLLLDFDSWHEIYGQFLPISFLGGILGLFVFVWSVGVVKLLAGHPGKQAVASALVRLLVIPLGAVTVVALIGFFRITLPIGIGVFLVAAIALVFQQEILSKGLLQQNLGLLRTTVFALILGGFGHLALHAIGAPVLAENLVMPLIAGLWVGSISVGKEKIPDSPGFARIAISLVLCASVAVGANKGLTVRTSPEGEESIRAMLSTERKPVVSLAGITTELFVPLQYRDVGTIPGNLILIGWLAESPPWHSRIKRMGLSPDLAEEVIRGRAKVLGRCNESDLLLEYLGEIRNEVDAKDVSPTQPQFLLKRTDIQSFCLFSSSE